MPITQVEVETLGACWLEISRRILDEGVDGAYDGLPMRELAHVTLTVEQPDPDDAVIAELGDPEWSAWMRANFTEPGSVVWISLTLSHYWLDGVIWKLSKPEVAARVGISV